MSYKHFLPLLLLFIVSCHPYPWQPVNKLISGTWIMSPNPVNGVTEKWSFDLEGCLTISHWDDDDNLIKKLEFVTSATDPTLTTCVTYSTQNKFHKQYVFTDQWFLGGNPDLQDRTIGKWLVIMINKEEMYLSAEVDNAEGVSIKGAVQKGFVKEITP